MVDVIFITTLILGGILKYLELNTQYFILVFIYILLTALLYLNPKINGKKCYIYCGASIISLFTIYILNYSGIIKFTLYDSLLIILSFYIAAIVSAKRQEEIIFLTIVLVLLGGVMYYTPNLTIKDIYKISPESLEKIPLMEKVKYGYNYIMNLSNIDSSYLDTISHPNTESTNEREKIIKNTKKNLLDIISLDVFPTEIKAMAGEYPITITLSNLMTDKEIKNVRLGITLDNNAKKYGIKLMGTQCDNKGFSCYEDTQLIPEKGYQTSMFQISLPPCNIHTTAQIFSKYISRAESSRSIYIANEDMGKTYSTDGPLTIDIEFQPQKIYYGGKGDLSFYINLYTVLDSRKFKKYYSYYKYLVLEVPSEVNLKRNSISCPFDKYIKNKDKKDYIFEIKDNLACTNGNKIGILSCKAIVNEENADMFTKGYRNFKVFLPYVFYGITPYSIKVTSSDNCKNIFQNKTFGLEETTPLEKEEYLVALKGKIMNKEEINEIIQKVYDFCSSNFQNYFQNAKCAYIVIKDYNQQPNIQNIQSNKQNKTQQSNNIENFIKSLEKDYLEDKGIGLELVNDYDGKGDLVIDASYIFNCNERKIKITLR